MKEIFNNSSKKSQQRPGTLNEILMFSMFIGILFLSTTRNNLFLKELIVCGFIIFCAVIGAQLNNKN